MTTPTPTERIVAWLRVMSEGPGRAESKREKHRQAADLIERLLRDLAAAQERIKTLEEHSEAMARLQAAALRQEAAAQEALREQTINANSGRVERELWAQKCDELEAAQERVRELEDTTCNAEELRQEREARQAAEARAEEAMRVLRLANDSCRSAYQIAARKGSETDWETWQFALQKSLKEQHRFMYPEQYAEDRIIRSHDSAIDAIAEGK